MLERSLGVIAALLLSLAVTPTHAPNVSYEEAYEISKDAYVSLTRCASRTRALRERHRDLSGAGR
jgi:hypothetical protein